LVESGGDGQPVGTGCSSPTGERAPHNKEPVMSVVTILIIVILVLLAIYLARRVL